MATSRRHVAALYAQYFLNSVLGDLPDIAMMLYLKECGFSLFDAAAILTAVMLPWLYGGVFGWISDKLRKRKALLLFAHAAGVVVWIALILVPPTQTWWIPTLLWLAESCLSLWSVVNDAVLVSYTHYESNRETSDLVQFNTSWFAQVGRVVSLLLGGLVAQIMTMQQICALQIAINVFAAMAARALSEPAFVDGATHQPSVMQDVNVVLKNDSIREMARFLFALLALPGQRVVFFYFLNGPRGFSTMDIGFLDAAGCVLVAVGSFAFPRWLKRIPLRPYYAVVACLLILCVTLRLLVVERWNVFAGIPDGLMVLAVPLTSGLHNLAFAPYALAVTGACPLTNVGTVYTILTYLPATAVILAYFGELRLITLYNVDHGNYQGISGYYTVMLVASVVPLCFLPRSVSALTDDAVSYDAARSVGRARDAENIPSAPTKEAHDWVMRQNSGQIVDSRNTEPRERGDGDALFDQDVR